MDAGALKSEIPYVKPLLITGPPGSGKTYLLQSVCRIVQNLPFRPLWEIIALSARRSCVIGGQHLHTLFGFKVDKSKPLSAYALAASALNTLRSKPVNTRLLRSLSVLFVDEFGQIGAMHLAAMSLVMQSLRGNRRPFGGALVIVCSDHYQTEPINEPSPLTSSLVRFCFVAINLRTVYRARGDPILRQMIFRMRVPQMTSADIEWVIRTLFCHCKLVADASGVPIAATWLLATHAAVQQIRLKRYEDSSEKKSSYPADDQILRAGTWVTTADARYKKLLDRLSGLDHCVNVVVGETMAVTLNTTIGPTLIANGEMGTAVDVQPNSIQIRFSSGAVHSFNRVFSQVSLGRGRLELRRHQFCVEMGCSDTVHGSQGDTKIAIATRLDDQWQHQMWSRMQFFTLLTRVQHLRDIYFVGALSIPAIRRLLEQRNHWHAQVDHWIAQVDLLHPQTGQNPYVDPPLHFYEPKVLIPPTGENVVYILQSHQSLDTYVGSTKRMPQRLSEHNSGRGSWRTCWTDDWVLQACVQGFEEGESGLCEARRFESHLQHRFMDPSPSIHLVLRMAFNLMCEWNERLLLEKKSPLWMNQ